MLLLYYDLWPPVYYSLENSLYVPINSKQNIMYTRVAFWKLSSMSYNETLYIGVRSGIEESTTRATAKMDEQLSMLLKMMQEQQEETSHENEKRDQKANTTTGNGLHLCLFQATA